MIINPEQGKEYTLSQLETWWMIAQQTPEQELIIDPCNPGMPKILQTKATIRKMDDLAVLTQWLGGLLP
jgi:hypothetical protein